MTARSPAPATSPGNDDERLVIEAAKKDPRRFAELYEQNFDRVYAFALRRAPTREAAESATERILARAFAQLAGYDGSTPFSAWLLAIVKRELRSSEPASRSPFSGGASLTGTGA